MLVVAACVGYLIYSASGGSSEYYLTVSELRAHPAYDQDVRVAGVVQTDVKYAPRGTAVRVSAGPANGGVETVVANTTGDHRPDPERMFERFYRADASRSAAAGGVGLGLAISRELVSAMKGTLRADLDGGNTIRMRLSLPSSS